MRVEICRDTGLTILCEPIKKLEVVKEDEGKITAVFKGEPILIDKSKYRIHVDKKLFGLIKQEIIRYYVDQIPASSISVDDYKKLKQLEIEMNALMKNALGKQLQLYFIIAMVVVGLAIIGMIIVGARPTNVSVNIPEHLFNTTTTTTPLVVPPP